MEMVKYIIGTAATLSVILIFAGLTAWYIIDRTAREDATKEVTCHAFHVAFPSPQGDFVYFGESELCGENMEWSTIRGPIGVEKPEVKQQSILR